MAAVGSNSGDVLRALAGLAGALDLTRGVGGGARRLGDELVDTAAVAIRTRTIQRQTDPDGQRLAALSRRYLRWKTRHGFPATIGFKSGAMLALLEIRGEVIVTRNDASMTYGTGDDTRQRADFFQEGTRGRRRRRGRARAGKGAPPPAAAGQPPRRFYDLGADGEAAVDVLLGEVIDRAVADAGGG